MKSENTHHRMTTKTNSFFKIVIVVLTSLSLVGCTTHVYNYNPVDPSKKIEYNKSAFTRSSLLMQDGKIVTYDEAVKFLSEQDYSKSFIKSSQTKQTWGRIIGLSGAASVLVISLQGATFGQSIIAVLLSFIGLGTFRSSENDMSKAVDQHNAHIEQTTLKKE